MAIPFPFLNTKRLYLREVVASDAVQIHFLRSDKTVNRYIKRPQPQTLEIATAHIQKLTAAINANQAIAWGIMLQDSPTLIGTIGLRNFSADRKTAEVGYDLDPIFHRQGIMSEALKAVLDFGFTHYGLQTIMAFTDYRNSPSKKLLKQHGFIPSCNLTDPDNQDNEVYHLNR
ncbi:GNAT family N-acetyltransferase [Aequorivita marina]|uniref:GNAT family N-acetyltransferase n=1 Tax=Aequorivita marina TaxID=3073654 RepID=UPI0028762507|nr:GNAT family N-acetyltransferase [Aequorivita sp. S2608]MDS1299793.1 GNAT family N-acetyltransferase [Aequorivita sp. S2608]